MVFFRKTFDSDLFFFEKHQTHKNDLFTELDV